MDSLAIPVGRIEDGKSAKCRTILLCVSIFNFKRLLNTIDAVRAISLYSHCPIIKQAVPDNTRV